MLYSLTWKRDFYISQPERFVYISQPLLCHILFDDEGPLPSPLCRSKCYPVIIFWNFKTKNSNLPLRYTLTHSPSLLHGLHCAFIFFVFYFKTYSLNAFKYCRIFSTNNTFSSQTIEGLNRYSIVTVIVIKVAFKTKLINAVCLFKEVVIKTFYSFNSWFLAGGRRYIQN